MRFAKSAKPLLTKRERLPLRKLVRRRVRLLIRAYDLQVCEGRFTEGDFYREPRKYRAWTKDGGWIHVTWCAAELLQFRWREHDGPTLAPPVREGLGRKLIKSSLPGARVEHSFKSDGL